MIQNLWDQRQILFELLRLKITEGEIMCILHDGDFKKETLKNQVSWIIKVWIIQILLYLLMNVA